MPVVVHTPVTGIRFLEFFKASQPRFPIMFALAVLPGLEMAVDLPEVHRASRMEELPVKTNSDHIMDLIALAEAAREAGAIQRQEELVILHAATLSARRIRTVMVPADSVKAFDFRKTLHENIHDLGLELHRSYPVSRDGSLENVEGYIRVRDLLARDLLSKGGGEDDWHPLIRPLIEIDGNASLSSLLTRFLESGEIAALVKKDGSNSGWITLDDVTGTLLGTRG